MRLSKLEQRIGNALGIMANHVALDGEVTGNAAYAERFNALNISLDRGGAFRRIARQRLTAECAGVHQCEIEDRRARVLVDTFDMR